MQSDNIQSWCTPFPVLKQSIFPCLVLTVASEYRFSRRQVRSSGSPISLRIFQFVVIHTIKGFLVVNETVTDIFFFLEFPCFLYDPANIGNLISGPSAFSKPSLYIRKFSIHILLKPTLKDFEPNFTSMLNEHNCPVV